MRSKESDIDNTTKLLQAVPKGTSKVNEKAMTTGQTAAPRSKPTLTLAN